MTKEQDAASLDKDKASLEASKKKLSQEEIDRLLGFVTEESSDDINNRGIRAMLDKALQSYERLPMLEIVFDRFVRILTSSLRTLTSETIDIEIRSITSLRFGNYINSVPIPALMTIFKAVEWGNLAILSSNMPLIFSLVEVLFGGRKSSKALKVEGRAYTNIEQSIAKQLSDIILTDLSSAFDPLSPVNFNYERTEVNPRFATIARQGDACILLQLRVEMEDRGGQIEILFPYSTLEPIKHLLLQVFMGEKFGKDSEWDSNLENEVSNVPLSVEVMLKPKEVSMKEAMNLKVGNIIVMDHEVEEDVLVKCSGEKMFSGKLGRIRDKMAVSLKDKISKNVKEGQE